jgi:preprotein translocase subunit SecG
MPVTLHMVLLILLFLFNFIIILLLLLSRPEQDEALGKLGKIMYCQFSEETEWENWIVFVRLMVRVSGGFFCTL